MKRIAVTTILCLFVSIINTQSFAQADVVITSVTPTYGYDFSYNAAIAANSDETFRISFPVNIVADGSPAGIFLIGGGAGNLFADYQVQNFTGVTDNFMFGFDFGTAGIDFVPGGTPLITPLNSSNATAGGLLSGPAAVPEPASMALLGLVSIIGMTRRRRQN